jgi:hypothetical protein
VAACATVALGGCGGSSQSTNKLATAATKTASSKGYQMAAVMTLSNTSAPVTAVMRGTINPTANEGTLRLDEVVGGTQVSAPMVFSGLNFWMRASAIPGAASLTGGKPWIYVDMNKALAAMGIGSLPGTTNPTQFLDYLSASSSNPKVVAVTVIHGVATTEYRAVVNLDRYKKLYHASAQTVAAIESAIGAHTMPVEAWVDLKNRVRRIHISFPECVDGGRVLFSLTMGIYGFGTKPPVQIPSRDQVYDLTPTLVSRYSHVKLGCTSAS